MARVIPGKSSPHHERANIGLIAAALHDNAGVPVAVHKRAAERSALENLLQDQPGMLIERLPGSDASMPHTRILSPEATKVSPSMTRSRTIVACDGGSAETGAGQREGMTTQARGMIRRKTMC
jgi:hypothetical protein